MTTTMEETGEVGALHSKEQLEEMQRLPLSRKIQITTARIIEWYQHYDGQVYVAFSGGKDSTVLLDIVRRIYPDVPAVFSDTGLEFPEVRAFVKTVDNVVFVRPKMNFRDIIGKYGYPVISKEQSFRIRKLRNQNLTEKYRASQMKLLGKKWRKMLDAPFECSEQCCDIMKKRPSKEYEKQTGKKPFIATMTVESNLRERIWLQHGCNAFDDNRPVSKPMSFWTEDDVLEYLYTFQIPYASIYGEIVRSDGGGWATTGEDRTGCVFCAFGAHLEKAPNRFQRLKVTHPKLWDYCMRSWEDHGLGMRRVLEYIGVPIE